MDRLTGEEADELREQLMQHDLPVNALANVLGVRTTSMQRFLSGKYAMPRPLADVLRAVMEFRNAARAQQTVHEKAHAIPAE